MLHFTAPVDGAIAGYTLIVPSVSVGNVGQLAIDLLISTLKCDKIGSVYHAAIMPLVGGNPFSNITSEPPTTSAEIYSCPSQKILFLQIRSPIIKGHLTDFIKQLVEWVVAQKLERVIILTGSTYLAGSAEVIGGDRLRYICTPNLQKENRQVLNDLHWKMVEEDLTGHLDLPGSGFATILHDKCELLGIRSAVIVKYCSEGDNVPDAYQLTEYLNQWIKVVVPKRGSPCDWYEPPSWTLLYGRSALKRIY